MFYVSFFMISFLYHKNTIFFINNTIFLYLCTLAIGAVKVICIFIITKIQPIFLIFKFL
jgi:hypothetical protein